MVRLRFDNAFCLCIVTLALVIGGCSGGGGGGGLTPMEAGTLQATNFVAFLDPQGQIVLPTIFIDQALEFEFGGAIDDGILGGFISDTSGNPIEYLGVAPTVGTAVPYYAYADQVAAQSALQIMENVHNAIPVIGYFVGRHRDKPDTIVVDPRIPIGSPTGLAPSFGFGIATEYTYRIPANSGLTVAGGVPVQPVGVDPMLLPTVIKAQPPLPEPSPLFTTGTSTAPDPVPPQVVSIDAVGPMGVVAGTSSDPMPAMGSFIRITFSKPIDPVSVDLLQNIQIRNTDVATAGEPNGRLVPGNLSINPATPNVAAFTPLPTWGPGVSMTQGYAISVAVGTFGNPAVSPLMGLPQGNPPVQLEVSNSLSVVILTEPCPTCQGSVAVIERFESNAQEDAAFVPPFGSPAGWSTAADPNVLSGSEISGTPLATFNGNPGNLGTRTQAQMPIGVGTTLPLTTIPFQGLFSPFDSAANNLGPGINPAGGSHSMWLVEPIDLGAPAGSLELIEWSPVNDVTVPTTYPQFQCWVGLSTITAPINCPGGVTGMSTIYSANYNVAPFQQADPNNLNPNQTLNPGAGGVLVTPSSSYVVPPSVTTYHPFPVLTPPFDYIGSNANRLIYEVNIEPGMQVANYNRFRATNFVPVRRIIGAPLSSGFVTASAGGCDIYASRFTFVDMVSATRSLFYDTGVAIGTPSYGSLAITPSPVSQPAGTASKWEFEGAMAILNPFTPSGPSTGFLTYWDGGPGTGIFDPLILENPANPSAPQLTGNRYFRFQATLRNDNVTNARQLYQSIVAAIIISP